MPLKFRRTVLLVAPLSLMLWAIPAAATSTVPQWHAAKVVSLPSGATGLPDGFLPALSCPSAGNCSAGGSYFDDSGNVQGLVLREVKGVWKAPSRLIPPSQADADPSLTINSLSCSTAGNCVAVGSFEDTHSNGLSFVADEVNGVWKRATNVALPANAGSTVQNSELHSVLCWSPGDCSAIGSYLDNTQPTGYAQGFEVNEVRGKWDRAQETKLPADANVDPYVDINQVACTHAGNCLAVGSYINKDSATEGLVIPEVRGAWRNATAVVLPGNASAYPGAHSERGRRASRPGNCTAIGTYTERLGGHRGHDGDRNARRCGSARSRWSCPAARPPIRTRSSTATADSRARRSATAALAVSTSSAPAPTRDSSSTR